MEKAPSLWDDSLRSGSGQGGKVVDLLPDRESATIADWLREHPGTQIVSRDRASSYAEAARRAAPGAVQIADRWHLLNNLSEALRTALEPHRRIMAQAAQNSQPPDLIEPPLAPQVSVAPAITTKQKNRERRHTLYQQVNALVAPLAGISLVGELLHCWSS
jgi:transposase